MRGYGLQFNGTDRFTTTQAITLGGAELSRSVWIKKDLGVGQASYGRWLDTFVNTTDTPLTIKVAFGGQSGYSASGANSSALVNTSSGDASIAAGDTWAEVATPLSGTTLVGGPQATVIGTPAPFAGAMTFTGNWLNDTFNNPFAVGGHEGNFQAYVNTLTIPAGASKSVLHFVVLGQRVTTATSAAERLKVEATASSLAATPAPARGVKGGAPAGSPPPPPDLAGLTVAETCAIDNFRISADCAGAGAVPR